MTIRALAAEYYKAIREVETLKNKVHELSADSPIRPDLEQQLRQARAERDHVKNMLDGAKTDSDRG